MNGTFQANSSINDGGFNLYNEGNLTSASLAIHFQFMSLIYSAYIIISLVSVFGNSIIIHIIRTDNSAKTTTNYLILNQACADLLITMVELTSMHIPFNYLGYRWFEGSFGLITCKTFLASTFVLPIFSIWILVAIAVERFYAVIRPLVSSPISRHLKKTVLLLWLWSVASSTNILVHGKLVKYGEYCYCHLSNGWMFELVLSTALNNVLPLLIIAVLYIFVCRKLWSREVPGEGANHNQQQVEAIETAKKVTIMMIVIVILYVVCWIPLDVYDILAALNYVEIDLSFYLFLIWLTVAFSGLNPYVYLVFSRKFRNGFKQLFGSCLRKIKIHNALSFRSRSWELEQI